MVLVSLKCPSYNRFIWQHPLGPSFTFTASHFHGPSLSFDDRQTCNSVSQVGVYQAVSELHSSSPNWPLLARRFEGLAPTGPVDSVIQVALKNALPYLRSIHHCVTLAPAPTGERPGFWVRHTGSSLPDPLGH